MSSTTSFQIKSDQIRLTYSPSDGIEWVLAKFKNNESINISRTFYLSEKQLIKPNIQEEAVDSLEGFVFVFAIKKEKYWRIEKDILATKYAILIAEDVFVQKIQYAHISDLLPNVSSIKKMFIAEKGISVFGRIDKLCDEQIIVGGNDPEAIPLADFNLFIAKFPTSTEIKHYANSRITNILQEYFPSMSDGEQRLQQFFRKKENRLKKISPQRSGKSISIPNELYQIEIEKFSGIKEIIQEELNNNPNNYSEAEWQKIIAEILPLIFPQYIAVLSEVPIKESYSNEIKPTNRRIDFVLVNANGYIDILEIKKAFDNCILMSNQYRDNYIPKKELSGTVMQAEKYIYYLNSLNRKDEEQLTEKYQDQLPDGLKIQIRNPKALILLGRSNEFEEHQKNDFEFIKRKYTSIMDILTYDDLLSRIGNMIKSLEGKNNS